MDDMNPAWYFLRDIAIIIVATTVAFGCLTHKLLVDTKHDDDSEE